jgi:hypothetical protein
MPFLAQFPYKRIKEATLGRFFISEYGLNAPNFTIFQHNLDTMRVSGAFGQYASNNPLCQHPTALIMLFHDLDS